MTFEEFNNEYLKQTQDSEKPENLARTDFFTYKDKKYLRVDYGSLIEYWELKTNEDDRLLLISNAFLL